MIKFFVDICVGLLLCSSQPKPIEICTVSQQLHIESCYTENVIPSDEVCTFDGKYHNCTDKYILALETAYKTFETSGKNIINTQKQMCTYSTRQILNDVTIISTWLNYDGSVSHYTVNSNCH